MYPLSPSETPQGQFSPLLSLLRLALGDIGESSPDIALSMFQERLILCANRVVNDVNQHPLFFDIMSKAFAPVTGTMTAGDNALALSGTLTARDGSNVAAIGTPVQVVGAGSSAGDLFTTILYASSTTATETADAALASVVDTVVKSPYRLKLARYRSASETRAIDDLVLIEGVKYYYSLDDSILPGTKAQVTSLRYTEELNKWLVGLLGYNGGMEIEPSDPDY